MFEIDAPIVPAVCPVLIGRAGSLALLSERVLNLGSGSGSTLVIAGEEGVGKSRLAGEAIRLARSSPALSGKGVAVLVGRCIESDRSVPHAPILDLLRSAFAYESDPASCFTDGTASELRAVLTTRTTPAADWLSLQEEGPPTGRGFTYHVLDFLECLSAERPLLLVVEDLHWSDDASLKVLHLLAGRISANRSPILLVLTYRTDQVGHALHEFLSSLMRSRIATEIPLRRLGAEEVGRMVGAMVPGVVPHPRFVDWLYGLTDGNPFFVEEALQTLSDARVVGQEPALLTEDITVRLRSSRPVQAFVQARLRALSHGARRLVRVSAVAGRRFDFPLLRRLNPKGHRRLLAQLKELVSANLLVEDGAERFAFRHALTREAVLSDMLAVERQGIHRAIAEIMERSRDLAADTRLPELAYHYFQARSWKKAADYAVLAAEEAISLGAPEAAAEHVERGLLACGFSGQSVPPKLLALTGRALSLTGRASLPLSSVAAGKKGAALRRSEKWQFDGLTAREREVAALIARGESNRAIATILVLAERTVESHVSSILTKLGFASRTQIAAWAMDKGLRAGAPPSRPPARL